MAHEELSKGCRVTEVVSAEPNRGRKVQDIASGEPDKHCKINEMDIGLPASANGLSQNKAGSATSLWLSDLIISGSSKTRAPLTKANPRSHVKLGLSSSSVVSSSDSGKPDGAALTASQNIHSHFNTFAAGSIPREQKAVTSQAKSLTSSHKPAGLSGFELLPTEIRIMIWRYTLPGSRTVLIYWKDIVRNNWVSPSHIPPALHICQESRYEALNRYETAFGRKVGFYKPGKIIFDFMMDTLVLMDSSTPGSRSRWSSIEAWFAVLDSQALQALQETCRYVPDMHRLKTLVIDEHEILTSTRSLVLPPHTYQQQTHPLPVSWIPASHTHVTKVSPSALYIVRPGPADVARDRAGTLSVQSGRRSTALQLSRGEALTMELLMNHTYRATT